MTKRVGNDESTNGKKLKLDEEEQWDQGIDDDALDKYFEVATQLYEQSCSQIVHINAVQTYDSFKKPTNFICSTQGNNGSKHYTTNNQSVDELKREIELLKQQNKEKEGEISILRNKLKDNSSNIETSHLKTISEWRDKYSSTLKQLEVIKSDLRFKNLEVANLKQDMLEIKRTDCSAFQPSTSTHVNCTRVSLSNVKNKENACSSRKEIMSQTSYPLKQIKLTNYDTTLEEKHLIKITSHKLNPTASSYLQNVDTNANNDQLNAKHKCPERNGKEIDLTCIYTDILRLVNSSSDELNSSNVIESVNKIICITVILLEDLNDYLIGFGSYLRTEDIQKADTDYLLDCERQCDDSSSDRNIYEKDEYGIKAGKILEFLAHLVLYNNYSAEYICNKATLMLSTKNRQDLELVSHKTNFEQNDFYVLKLLLNIVTNIGKYRKTWVMTGFLMNVTNLLISIGILNNPNYTYQLIENGDLFCNIFKEIVFARPKIQIMQRLTHLLKIGSRYSKFVEYLFIKRNRDRLQRSSKGVLYYTDAVCPFCILGTLLQNTLFKTSKLTLNVCHNLMSFFYNTLIVSPLMHHDTSGNVCACLAHLYRLQIDCVYNILISIKADKSNYEQYRSLINDESIDKIMSLINFNNNELVEKHVIDYSRFKEAEEILHEIQHDVANLNISDDVIEVPASSFSNIDF